MFSRVASRIVTRKFTITLVNSSRPVGTASARFVSSAANNTSASTKLAWTAGKFALAAGVGIATFASVALATEVKAPNPDDFVSAVVGKADLLKDGEMTQVVVDGVKILLSKVDGKYYATDLNCTHFGAPLNTGVLSGERVVCPWHNAAFNVKTGKLEDDGGPATDYLNTYEVMTDEATGNLIVTVPKERKKRTPSGRACRCHDKRTFVIVGGGGAGAVAAETLRQEGFKGQLIIITKEKELPYDRTALSKGFGTPVEKILLRSEDFYKTNGIQVHREREVESVNTKEKVINFKDGSTLSYDSVLLALGGSPRTLPVEGHDLENVLTLRSVADNKNIAEALKESKKIVIVGAGFIGLETASALKLGNKDLNVTIVAPEPVPLARVFGDEVGKAIQQHSIDNGVNFKLGRVVKTFQGDSAVKKVVLDNGEVIDADLVIVGVGIQPNTDVVKEVNKTPNGAIVVDKYLKAKDDTFAAGDITSFPYTPLNTNISVEHWAVAQNQGRIAAYNMLGKDIPFQAVPFFWTRMYNASLQYVGHAQKFDDVIIKGNPVAKKFVAYYVYQNKVVAVAAMGSAAAGAAASELFRLNKFPSPQEIKKADDSFSLPAYLKSVLNNK